MVLFFQYYLRDYVAEYFKHRSTFTSMTKYQYKLPLPNIIVCTDPAFKPSRTEKYGYSFASQIWKDQKGPFKKFGLSPWETYQKLTYEFNKDIKFKVGSWKQQKRLKKGVNFFQNQTIRVSQLATYRHGLCTMIESKQKMLVGEEFKLQVQWTHRISNSSDLPEKLTIYLTSAQGWYGLYLDDWPYIRPAKFTVKPSVSKKHGYTIKLSMKEKIYLMGSHNFKNCMTRLISEFGCDDPCYPLIFNNILDLQPCQNYKDTKCMVDNLTKHRKQHNQCLKPQKDLIYQADKYHNAEYDNKSTSSIFLKFYFVSPMVEILEEIPEISFPDFAGSVGGSLGLFIGFSCYTCLSKLVDKIFDLFYLK